MSDRVGSPRVMQPHEMVPGIDTPCPEAQTLHSPSLGSLLLSVKLVLQTHVTQNAKLGIINVTPEK